MEGFCACVFKEKETGENQRKLSHYRGGIICFVLNYSSFIKDRRMKKGLFGDVMPLK